MLVEINLLPEKEAKNRVPLYIMGGFLCAALILSGIMFFQVQTNKAEAVKVGEQVKQVNQMQQTLKRSLNQYESNDSVAKLQTAVEWAESNPAQRLPIMKKLISFLPERGFFQSFTLDNDQTINLTVQFDTSSDAAYYLSRILDSPWFSDAKLISLNTKDLTNSSASNESQSQDSSQAADSSILPRYIANYQITFDPSKMKKQDEGGDHS